MGQYRGNYGRFPSLLNRALREVGLPEYILHDDLCMPGRGEYLAILEEYGVVAHWEYATEGYGKGHLYLRERSGGARQEQTRLPFGK